MGCIHLLVIVVRLGYDYREVRRQYLSLMGVEFGL